MGDISKSLNGAVSQNTAKPAVFLIDDDPLITESLGFILSKQYQVFTAESRAEAKILLTHLDHKPQLALVDLGLPPLPHDPAEGFALIEDLLAQDSHMKILVLSGQSDEKNMHHALTLGAVDFIPKPADPALLQSRLSHHLMLQQLESKHKAHTEHSEIIGVSASMSALREQVSQFADSVFPVLIEGESGTGKELVAQALHQQSLRAQKPYLIINCAAIAPELLESQLFGHAKGAFTGAQTARKGFFEEADHGTLFLDEIGEMPYELQAKLLRVLESGEFYRLGETRCQKTQCRIVAATNRTLRREVEMGHFRSDLFHRLSILKISIPAVRDRESDSLILFTHFLDFYSSSMTPVKLSDAAISAWKDYQFPGNVRELRNIVIRLCTRFPGQTISVAQLKQEFEEAFTGSDDFPDQKMEMFSRELIQKELLDGNLNLKLKLKELEDFVIQQAMILYDRNLSQVAKALQINRTTLYSRIHKDDQK